MPLGLTLEDGQWVQIRHKGETLAFRVKRRGDRVRLAVVAPLSFDVVREDANRKKKEASIER